MGRGKEKNEGMGLLSWGGTVRKRARKEVSY